MMNRGRRNFSMVPTNTKNEQEQRHELTYLWDREGQKEDAPGRKNTISLRGQWAAYLCI